DHIFTGERSETIFGRQLRVYSFNSFEAGFGESVADSLGVTTYWSDVRDQSLQLTGAVIHGVAYGNITTSSELINVPEISFSLSQNCPNPFNPSTTISFSIPLKSFVSLRIFN